jgi:polysaccharide biosynthesis transport protein
VFKDQHLGELPTQTQSNLQILTGLQSQVQANQDSLNRAKQQNTYLESLINQYRAMDRSSKPGEGGPCRISRDRQRSGSTEGAVGGFDFALHR